MNDVMSRESVAMWPLSVRDRQLACQAITALLEGRSVILEQDEDAELRELRKRLADLPSKYEES